jgi:glycosyltransferase involved in cell wall biosynthesis
MCRRSHLFTLTPVAWNYLTWFHRQCQVTFYPCRGTGDALAARDIPRLVYWGRGIDPNLFNPKHRDENIKRRFGPGPLLLYVGRLAAEKEPEVAMAALARIRQQYPQAKLLMAGDGPLGANLRRQTPPGVVFLGLVQGEDLSRLYASCDLFLFPSTTETYGNVILEAMASGLPVVAPLSGGIAENLRPGYNGLECEPHSPAAMARAALTLLENRALRLQMAAQARRHAESRTWTRALAPVIETYEQVLAERYPLCQAS